MSAFVGMTTKYAEGVLAVKYRTVDENGEIAGGPMYYIQNGMGKKTDISEYAVQHRGGKGVKCYKITEKTGKCNRRKGCG